MPDASSTAVPDAPTLDPAAAAEAYHRDGYVVLRGCFNAGEVIAASKECWRLLSLDLVEPENHRTQFTKSASRSLGIPERIDPVLDLSPLFRKLVNDPRLTDVLHAIYGGPALVFKDKLIFKAPGVQGYAMHQDASWWQGYDLPIDALLSVAISIDDADAENGCIEVFPGYHDRLLSAEGEMRDMTDQEAAVIRDEDAFRAETKAGDVVIFHALTPHRSGKNDTHRPRRSLYLTYNDARHGDLHDTFYKRDIRVKMEGRQAEVPGLYYR
ncbi:MAG: phytanoyl-CoA dioxygenase family protein [Planctomycetota bacterium]